MLKDEEIMAARLMRVYELRLTMDDQGGRIKPLWRTLRIPGVVQLGRLSELIQVVMQWSGLHMHDFKIGGVRFGDTDPEHDYSGLLSPDLRDEWEAPLDCIFRDVGASVHYTYDFGESWEVSITVEGLGQPDDHRLVYCTGGDGGSPPEDGSRRGKRSKFSQAATNRDLAEYLDWLNRVAEGDADDEDLAHPLSPLGPRVESYPVGPDDIW